jgi:epoxyqueuosine reductase QueG
MMKDGCGNCHECVDIYPAKGFTSEPYRAVEPRELRYNARNCGKYLSKLEKTSALGVCSMCLYACPYGKKEINNRYPQQI